MATGNFHNENASKIFACDLEDEWSFDDLKDNLFYELVALEKTNPFAFYHKSGKDTAENRNFSSTVIGTLKESKCYSNFEVTVNVVAVIRSGYYSGCNLDYVFDFTIEGQDTDDTNDFADILEYQLGSANMANYKAKFARKWAEATKEKLTDLLEKLYEQWSTPLVVTARFSNGETIYSKA